MSRLSVSLCEIQNPSLHHGICSSFHFRSSLSLSSFRGIFNVFTLMDLFKNDKEYFLNSSKSVSFLYLSIKFSLNSISSAFGISLGALIELSILVQIEYHFCSPFNVRLS